MPRLLGADAHGDYGLWVCKGRVFNAEDTRTIMLVVCFNDQKRYSAGIEVKDLRLFHGEKKGVVINGPHKGMNWERGQ